MTNQEKNYKKVLGLDNDSQNDMELRESLHLTLKYFNVNSFDELKEMRDSTAQAMNEYLNYRF